MVKGPTSLREILKELLNRCAARQTQWREAQHA